MAALPSTVSSSVVMVSLAKGNVPAAIFNASISGLIGVLITPLWMSFFLVFRTENVFVDVYVGLFTEIILPVMLGLLLQRYAGNWARKHSKALSTFDRLVILLIVYGSFAHSFVDGIFGEVGYKHLVFVAVGVVVLFILVYWLTHLVSKLLGFSREDEITALFCGSKKSLTHGSVFGKFLFVNNPYAGLYFLPIMSLSCFS
ncbi:bile acid:sodium symporter [Sphingobacterium sp. T2]|uniref:bile acid:sodium symporter n=1 Tax=Sphingobacterium sp. T2 TaxID=1590596 RepID=UPI00397E8887